MNNEYRKEQLSKLVRNLERSIQQVEFIERLDNLSNRNQMGGSATAPRGPMPVAAATVSGRAPVQGQSGPVQAQGQSGPVQAQGMPSPGVAGMPMPVPQMPVAQMPVAQQTPQMPVAQPPSQIQAPVDVHAKGIQDSLTALNNLPTQGASFDSAPVVQAEKDLTEIKSALNNLLKQVLAIAKKDDTAVMQQAQVAVQSLGNNIDDLKGLFPQQGGGNKIVDLEFKL
jgi:hypothetical protein